MIIYFILIVSISIAVSYSLFLSKRYTYYLTFIVLSIFHYLFYFLGKDYEGYIYLIDGARYSGTLVAEPGMLFLIKSLIFFGLNNAAIIIIFKIFTVFLFLRFFYQNSFPILSLIIYVLLPNLFLSSISTLQTSLSIGICCQALISTSNKHKGWIYLAAFSIHFGAITFLLVEVISYFFNKNKIFFTSALTSLAIILIGESGLLSYLAYFDLLNSTMGDSLSPIFSSLLFLSPVAFLLYLNKNVEKIFSNEKKFIKCASAMLIAWSLIYTFQLRADISLRLFNFFIPSLIYSICLYIKDFSFNEKIILGFSTVFILLIRFFSTLTIDGSESFLIF